MALYIMCRRGATCCTIVIVWQTSWSCSDPGGGGRSVGMKGSFGCLCFCCCCCPLFGSLKPVVLVWRRGVSLRVSYEVLN